jgi:hypothetical protein
MGQIGAAADVHVQAGDRQPRPFGAAKGIRHLCMPDAVLRTLATGVGLLAVAVAKAGVDAERYVGTRHPLSQLLEHVG